MLSRGGCRWARWQYAQPGGHCSEGRRPRDCTYSWEAQDVRKHITRSTLQTRKKNFTKKNKLGRPRSATGVRHGQFMLNAGQSRVANVPTFRQQPALKVGS